MESLISLQAIDGFLVYGTLNTSSILAKQKRKLIIFVHGITGNNVEHQYFNAVPFFNERGIDTFRLDLYSDEDNGRSLSDCNVSIHAADLLLVINHFKDKYEELYVVGHSLGATVILHTDVNAVKKVILWDPTKGMASLKQKYCEYNKELGKYIINWRMSIVVSPEMVDDWMKATDIGSEITRITKPCKFIFAGDNDIYEAWKPFVDAVIAKQTPELPIESVVIPGASHMFIEEGVARKVYEETLKWVEG